MNDDVWWEWFDDYSYFQIQTSDIHKLPEGGVQHTWAKGNLGVDGLCKKLFDDLFLFSLMNKQCSLLSLFWALP